MSVDLLALGLSVVALVLSGVTLWLAEFRRGRLLLSQPTIFFFGWDKADAEDNAKIFFRSALFSTAARGIVLENLYLKVSNDGNEWILPFWGYDGGSGMVRGSGLYVGREGHVANHHFNPISLENDFYYGAGAYTLEVWGKAYSRRPALLGSYQLALETKMMALELAEHQTGVLWTWDPIGLRYVPEASQRPALMGVAR